MSLSVKSRAKGIINKIKKSKTEIKQIIKAIILKIIKSLLFSWPTTRT